MTGTFRFIFKNRRLDSGLFEYLVTDNERVLERFACTPERAAAAAIEHSLTPASFADLRRMGVL